MPEHAAHLIEEARRASAAGENDRAIDLLEAARKAEPDNPGVLNMLANRRMAQGDAEVATGLLKRATELDPNAPALWLNLAAAERQRGSTDSEIEALDRALALEPYLLPALLQKGEAFERQSKSPEALRAYSAALTIASQLREMPAGLEPRLVNAKRFYAGFQQKLHERLTAVGAGSERRSPRFDHFVEVITGRQRSFTSQPTRTFFPGLPAVPFFEREQFPWLGELEAATATIRDELLGVMKAGTGMRPYVEIAATDPVNQWAELNRSLDWSAFFLWENGRRNDENCSACPKTAALLERLPLLDIPGLAPTAMFSILKPGAHIPPHTGETNVRAVVHLPLVVPPGCHFRVGHDQREWIEGQAWAFDDTIEHEARNGSDAARAILIVDAWNPYLSDEERTLLRAAEPVLKSVGSLS